MRKKSKTLNPSMTIEDKITELANRTAELTKQTEALQVQFRAARGTQRDMQPMHLGPVPSLVEVQPSEPIVREPAQAELYYQIKELITKQPMRFLEIKEQTGAEDNQIKSVMIRLQRDGHGVVNLGNQYKAIWFIPNAALLAKLRAKVE